MCGISLLWDEHTPAPALIREGAVFRGGSDTEILLRALLRWGLPETLDRIRGQFAFAWYDTAGAMWNGATHVTGAA